MEFLITLREPCWHFWAIIDIGGFKKSFSFSFRSFSFHWCRTCLVTKDTMSSSYVSESFKLRDDNSHDMQISMLSGPASDHYSVT